VQAGGGDADLAAEAELAPVGELGRGVDQDDGAVHPRREPFGGVGVRREDRLGVARAVAGDMVGGGVQIIDDPHRQDGRQIFGGPVGLRRRGHGGGQGASLGVAAQFASGGDQVGGDWRQQTFRRRPIHQQGLGRAADRHPPHLGVHHHGARDLQIGGFVQIGVV
jgi:hypothetical protein